MQSGAWSDSPPAGLPKFTAYGHDLTTGGSTGEDKKEENIVKVTSDGILNYLGSKAIA